MSGRGRGEPRGARGGGRGGPSRGGRGSGQPCQIFSYPDGKIPEPNRKVTTTENAVVSALDATRLGLNDLLPARPGYSGQGKPVTLWTNYIEVLPNPEVVIHRYDVSIIPEATGRKRYRLIQLFLQEGTISGHSNRVVSDFRSTVLSIKKLEPQEMSDRVTHRFENENVPSEGEQSRPYHVQLRSTGEFKLSDLIDFVTSTAVGREFETNKNEIIQALNIIVGYHCKSQPSDRMMSLGSNRHFALVGSHSKNFDLRGGLEAWRGYLSSVRTAAARVLLNVQVKHAAAYKSGPLANLIDEFAQAYGRNVGRLETYLKGVRIEVKHLKRSNGSFPVKRIAGLARPDDGSRLENRPRVEKFGAKPQEVLFFKAQSGQRNNGRSGHQRNALSENRSPQAAPPASGEYVTVKDHFKHEYNVDTSEVPVLNVGTRANPSYLPADVCRVVPGQTAKVKLSPTQTANMIRCAVRRPYENARSISGPGLEVLGVRPVNPTLESVLSIEDDRLITVHGRILNSPNVMYNNNKVAKTSGGNWNMRDIQFTRGKALKNWHVLWMCPSKHSDDPWKGTESALKTTIMEFTRALRRNGIDASNFTEPPIKVSITNDIEQTKRNIEAGFKYADSQKTTFLLIILADVDAGIHAKVKRCADVQFGIGNVPVVASNFSREGGKDQLFANIALKVNLKLGGTNQTLSKDALGFIADGKTMLVGIDVTHPAPEALEEAKSVAGMVASIGPDLGQFPAILRIQPGRQERVSELTLMLQSRLALWQKYNKNSLPERIIVFRDGVSEGQYKMVLENELPSLREACKAMYPATDTNANKPAMSLIVVGKRHNTRFYPTKADADVTDERSANPKNGTVVDRGITDHHHWNYYLQAHTVIQGTARPAHYFVVHDEMFNRRPFPLAFASYANGQEFLEAITHNLCYTFGRATKAVSICPPAYYADLVCERARCYIASSIDAGEVSTQFDTGGDTQIAADGALEVHERVKDTMFYI